MTEFGISLQRWILVALLPLMALLFWSSSSDPVNLPKSTCTALIAAVLLAVSASRVAATRRLVLPGTPALWAALALAVALFTAVVTSDVPGASLAGTHGRSDGLLLYGACLAIFATGVRVLDAASARWLLISLLVAGVIAATYGLLQAVHADPVNWATTGLSPIIGTFGNPDFESGFLGIAIPAAGWGAATRTWHKGFRIGCGVLIVGSFLAAGLSHAVQGVLAGVAGLVVVGIGMLKREHPATRPVIAGLAGLGLLGAVVVVAGAAGGVGPAARITGAGSVTARKWYWSSALHMWQHHPLTGVGLDRYGAYYRAFRPAAAAKVSNYSGAAHSVPLHLLATGGLVTFVPYLAVVLLVGWALVRALRSLDGEPRLLAAGLGGAWIAYQLQSLVSIDQPALATTHWVLAAGVVCMGAPPRRLERLLPGAVVPMARKGRAVPAPAPPPAVWSGASVGVVAVVVVLLLLGSWQLIKPLRADHASRAAAVALAKGDGNAAFEQVKTATRLGPYEQSYWLQRGRFLEQVKQPALAASSYASGVDHDARAYDVLLAGARLAKAQSDNAALDRYSRLLAVVDPSGRWREALAG